MFVKCKFSSSKVPLEKGQTLDVSFPQISNALHVLLGARPAPSKRKSYHKRNDFIDELANNSWIRFTNTYFTKTKNNKLLYYKEFTQGKKSAYNSNASKMLVTNEIGDKLPIMKGFLTWSSLKKRYYYLLEDKYNDAIYTFEKISGMSFKEIKSKYTLYKFLYEYSQNEKHAKELQDLGKRIGYTYLTNFTSCHFTNAGCQTNLSTLTINTNPIQKINLYGEIIFNIKDEKIIDILKYHSNQYATFLDGGMLKIDEIEDYIVVDGEYVEEDELQDYGFIQLTKN